MTFPDDYPHKLLTATLPDREVTTDRFGEASVKIGDLTLSLSDDPPALSIGCFNAELNLAGDLAQDADCLRAMLPEIVLYAGADPALLAGLPGVIV